jgi:putative hydrolase of the HAD superfamily
MPDKHPTLAVVFDLDDTLYAERDYIRSGYEAVARRLDDKLGRACVSPQGVPAGRWLWERFLAGRSDNAFNALGEHFGLELSGEDISALVEAYRTHRPQIRPYQGAEALLRGLTRPRLGLLSDGFLPAQQLKLDALGLGPLLDAIVFTEALGRECWKPSPAGFEAIGEQLGVEGDACAYVGDNRAKDFVAPNALGWRTIHLLMPDQVHAHQSAPQGGEPQEIADGLEALARMLRD